MTQITRKPAFPQVLPSSGVEASEWVLDTMFGARKADAWMAVVQDPSNGAQWEGGRYSDLSTALRTAKSSGHYFSCVLVRAGETRRLNRTTESGVCIFFDDVGEMGVNPDANIDRSWLDTFGLDPTFVVETSSGNFQYTYVFETPITPAEQLALVRSFKADAHTHGGFKQGNDLVRYGRLPSGVNPKPKKGSFGTRLVAGSGKTYNVDDLVAGFRIGKPDTKIVVLDADDDGHPRVLDVDTAVRFDLVERAVKAIINDLDRSEWIHMGHAIDGALEGDPWGESVFLEFSGRWTGGASDRAEDERAWRSLEGGRAGYGFLMKMLRKQNSAAAEAVLMDIAKAQAKVAFPPLSPPVADPVAVLDIFDAGDEKGDIEPRQWLLGTTFCRGYLSGLTSGGGSGKTTIRILQALSLATGRALSGEHVFARGRVLIVCLEDDLKELRRRVWAARIKHLIPASEVAGWLFLTTPRRLKIAELNGKKVVIGGLYGALVKAVDEKKLDLVCIDPAIKAHGLDESSNPDIDVFAGILTDMAVEKNIGVDLLSHERKGLAGAGKAVGDAERGRGASSLKDAMRLAKTLTVMSDLEATRFTVSDVDRKLTVRIDDAKVNIAPPSASTNWFRIVGVNLGNGTSIYPSGDNVQTCEVWTPVVATTANVAQETLWAAQAGGIRVRRGGRGARHDDVAATILRRTLGWSDPQAKKAVAKLVEDKLAVVVGGKDHSGNEIPFLEIVEPENPSLL